MPAKYRTTPLPSTKMPPGVPYIVGNEAAERFSYYGVTAILIIFLTHFLRDKSGNLAPLDEHVAREWQHNFIAAVYFFPIVGAVLSDWLLGRYLTIVSVSLLYCAGHACLSMMDYPQWTGIEPRTLLFAGLALIAVGAGGIKPCVAANVGDQFGPQNKHLLPRVYGWFYFSINFGSMFSVWLTPSLLHASGPGWAFGVPGIFMAIAAIVFWLGRHRYVHIPPGGRAFLRELSSRESLRAIANLVPLYLLLAPFWALYDQNYSTWIQQAEHMNRVVFGQEWLAERAQISNSILVLLYIPLFTYVVYPFLGRWFEVTPLRRIGIGMFLIAAAFAIVALIQVDIDRGGKPHIVWQLVAYVVLTAAEILVSITALEFSYTQAPRKLKSVIMGVFLLSMSLGDRFTALVNGYISDKKDEGVTILAGANYYWFFTGLMAITAVAYVVWSQFYRGQTYIQGEDAPQPAAA